MALSYKLAAQGISATTSGSVASLLTRTADLDWVEIGLLSIVIFSSLVFGSLARVSIIGASKEVTPETLKKEQKLSVGLFGALLVISWWMTSMSGVGIEGAALIAVANGAAGPVAIQWLIKKFFGDTAAP